MGFQQSELEIISSAGILSLAQLGNACILLALGLIVYALVTGIVGALRWQASLLTSARYAAVAVFLSILTALLIMEAALISDDFSVAYVAKHSSALAPLWVKIVMLWGALEGSILLWTFFLALYTAALALSTPNSVLRPWALNIMQLVTLFFVIVIAFIANPFQEISPAQYLGPGPNSLLQNHWMMAVHPVLMYLGFVGLTVPFAFAMSALITKRSGTEWMVLTRAWTLSGWGFLGAAIIAGGWWSYEVLGWGGWWAWDPVENVSFMPWLTATAFIHSVQVQERRRMLKSWNILLIVLTFALSILGTFLTRSGVLSSVHAFGDGPVGPAFLVFFIVIVVTTFGLLILRWDQVRDYAELDSAISREGSFLAGNVLFLAMTFAILLGTLFPLIVEAISQDKVTVGAPFFNQVSIPLWLFIFALMGIGPLLPWRKAKEQKLIGNLIILSLAGLITALVAYSLGMRKVYPLLAVGLCSYNLMSVVLLLQGALSPRLRQSQANAAVVFARYAHENRRRFGSMIVHLAIIVMAVGVTGAGAYRSDQQIRIDLGGEVEYKNYTLKAIDRFMEREPGKISAGAIIELWQNGRHLTTLTPKINVFTPDGVNAQQPVPTPDVFYRFQHDVYLNVSGSIGPDDDFVVLRVVQSPLVVLIWLGGLLMVLGTAYALIPSGVFRREAALSGASEGAAA